MISVLGNQLRAYYAESWFTAEGARLKARRLQQAGMPDLTNWRFVTLTMATRSISAAQAYEIGKARLRRFLARVRQALGRSFKWCWKLEFHEDGYAHWHLLLDYRQPLPPEILEELESWWGLGRTNVRRVKQQEIAYVLKYVAKGPEDHRVCWRTPRATYTSMAHHRRSAKNDGFNVESD